MLGVPEGRQKRLQPLYQHSGGLYVSAITLGELYAWIHRVNAPQRRLQSLFDMLSDVPVIPVDADVALRFGKERANLLDQGIQVPPTDLFIASTALQYDFTVVTHNTKHFNRVPRLRVEDWLTP